uniref:Uncharacterized protein n=1 Tax=Arundo donax TaxID=35708 RepID=A0A0A9H609_ARUDO
MACWSQGIHQLQVVLLCSLVLFLGLWQMS